MTISTSTTNISVWISRVRLVRSPRTRITDSLLDIALVNPYPPGLDDPEFVLYGSRFQDGKKLAQTIQDGIRGSVGRQLEDHQSARLLGWKAQYVSEIVVKCDEHPTFRRTVPENFLVRLSAQFLHSDRRDLVAGRRKERLPTVADVLVKLELHSARFSDGTEMNRPRAASAP